MVCRRWSGCACGCKRWVQGRCDPRNRKCPQFRRIKGTCCDCSACPEPVPNTGPGLGPPEAGLNRTSRLTREQRSSLGASARHKTSGLSLPQTRSVEYQIKKPPQKTRWLFDLVLGTGPFDSLAESARSLTVPDLDAKKGRKNRDPLKCPEQGTHLPIPRIREEFSVISVARIEQLRNV